MSDEEVAGHIAALSQLSVSELYLDRFEDGARHAERALVVARATGQVLLFPMLAPLCGSFWQLLGRLGEAADVSTGRSSRRGWSATPTAWRGRCSRVP